MNAQNKMCTFFSDATLEDFRHFDRFLRRRRAELENGPLLPLDAQAEYHNPNSNSECTVSSVPTEPEMEGYFGLKFNYQMPNSDKDKADSGSVLLPTVRYGRVSDSEAIIYAVQMPSEVSEYVRYSTAKSMLRQGEERKQRLIELLQESGGEYPFLEGDILDDEFFLDHLGWDNGSLLFLSQSSSRDLDTDKPLDFNIDRYHRFLERKSWLIESKARYENIALLNKRFRKSFKGPGKVKTVPAPVLASFLMTIKMLHKQGVRKIKIPMYIPLTVIFHHQKSRVEFAP